MLNPTARWTDYSREWKYYVNVFLKLKFLKLKPGTVKAQNPKVSNRRQYHYFLDIYPVKAGKEPVKIRAMREMGL